MNSPQGSFFAATECLWKPRRPHKPNDGRRSVSAAVVAVDEM